MATTTDERLQDVIHLLDSAILHMEMVKRDIHDEDVDYVIGHMKRAKEKVHALNFGKHHNGKKVVQKELF